MLSLRRTLPVFSLAFLLMLTCDASFADNPASLQWSTFLGGNSWQNGRDIAVDSSGNVCVVGFTFASDFPTPAGAFDTTFNGASDAFVAKLNPSGTSLIYSTYIGGSGGETAYGVAVDSLGNAYVAGSTGSADFPVTSGAFDTTYNGGSDGFVAKLNSAGTALVYSTYIGGSGSLPDIVQDIAVDSSGSVYVTGQTASADFPTTAGAWDLTLNGLSDAFVAKLNSSGSALVYSTYLGGSGIFESCYGIAVDGSGNAYVTGQTGSADFPTTAGAFDTTYNGGSSDLFITKLNSTGSSLVYSTFLGGNDREDGGYGIAVDSSGSAYVTGWTGSPNFPTTVGAFDTTYDGWGWPVAAGGDAFVTKLNSAGSSLVYSTFLGGSDEEIGYGIAVDGSGDAYVTGSTTSANFPTTLGAFDTTLGAPQDAFVARLNSTGSSLVYSSYLGGGTIGSGGDQGFGIAVDGSGSAYVTGRAGTSDFPTTPGAFDTTYNAAPPTKAPGIYGDVFVVKVWASQSPPPPPSIILTPSINAPTASTPVLLITGFLLAVALVAWRVRRLV